MWAPGSHRHGQSRCQDLRQQQHQKKTTFKPTHHQSLSCLQGAANTNLDQLLRRCISLNSSFAHAESSETPSLVSPAVGPTPRLAAGSPASLTHGIARLVQGNFDAGREGTTLHQLPETSRTAASAAASAAAATAAAVAAVAQATACQQQRSLSPPKFESFRCKDATPSFEALLDPQEGTCSPVTLRHVACSGSAARQHAQSSPQKVQQRHSRQSSRRSRTSISINSQARVHSTSQVMMRSVQIVQTGAQRSKQTTF